MVLTGLSTAEPSSADGNSSELEEDEEEVSRGGQLVPQTPDQEAFLKEHFVTLAELSSPGRVSGIKCSGCR